MKKPNWNEHKYNTFVRHWWAFSEWCDANLAKECSARIERRKLNLANLNFLMSKWSGRIGFNLGIPVWRTGELSHRISHRGSNVRAFYYETKSQIHRRSGVREPTSINFPNAYCTYTYIRMCKIYRVYLSIKCVDRKVTDRSRRRKVNKRSAKVSREKVQIGVGEGESVKIGDFTAEIYVAIN